MFLLIISLAGQQEIAVHIHGEIYQDIQLNLQLLDGFWNPEIQDRDFRDFASIWTVGDYLLR